MEKAFINIHVAGACGNGSFSMWRKACFENSRYKKIKNTKEIASRIEIIYSLLSLEEACSVFKKVWKFETSQQDEVSVLFSARCDAIRTGATDYLLI